MFGGGVLFGPNGTEIHHGIVVDIPSVVDQVSKNIFNAFDAGCIKRQVGVGRSSVLGSGTISDIDVFVGQYLGLGVVQVMVTDKDFLGVSFHVEATGALGVVPVEVDTRKFGAGQIMGDPVVFLDAPARIQELRLLMYEASAWAVRTISLEQ